ncbi:unnamed protein product [Paramecium sonneborni]|uniref:Uncharacterized protein n=1 Tax=Paramecium sonneborni TaxID=65129 RepID=A0A8S1MK26_9CILI|nr:unnamed protein product [Paramecium sonneborni]
MAFDKTVVTKITTLGVAGITLAVAIWGFFEEITLNNIMICINLIIISMVLLPSEFQVAWIKDGFGLIDNLFGRGIYIFFIGSWVFGLHSRYSGAGISTYAFIVGIIDLCVGVLYVIFYFAFGDSAQPK